MDKLRLRRLNCAMPWRARAAARDERAVLDLLIKADRGRLPWQATRHRRYVPSTIGNRQHMGDRPGGRASTRRSSPAVQPMGRLIHHDNKPGSRPGSLNAGLDELYRGTAELTGKTAQPSAYSDSDTRPEV
jgi:hypothetical protein